MSTLIPIHKDHVEKGMKQLHAMEQNLENDEIKQDILNARRQASYDMSYVDWANNSIRVMASYTVLLVIVFLALLLLYFFGDQIKSTVSNQVSSIGSYVGMGGSTPTTE